MMIKDFMCLPMTPLRMHACMHGAQGMGKNAVIISFHKNYTDFSNFLRDLRLESGDDLQDYDTLLISLKGKAVKPLSLKYLAELEET